MRQSRAPETFRVKSFGCQMNVYDGERMAELLAAQGLSAAEEGVDGGEADRLPGARHAAEDGARREGAAHHGGVAGAHPVEEALDGRHDRVVDRGHGVMRRVHRVVRRGEDLAHVALAAEHHELEVAGEPQRERRAVAPAAVTQQLEGAVEEEADLDRDRPARPRRTVRADDGLR